MYNISFSRTSTERADVNHTIRSMSYNVPGHQDRLKAICKRVQRELLDIGDKADMKTPNVLGIGRLQVRAFYAVCKMLPHLTPEKRLATAIVTTSNDAFMRGDKALIRQWVRNYG